MQTVKRQSLIFTFSFFRWQSIFLWNPKQQLPICSCYFSMNSNCFNEAERSSDTYFPDTCSARYWTLEILHPNPMSKCIFCVISWTQNINIHPISRLSKYLHLVDLSFAIGSYLKLFQDIWEYLAMTWYSFSFKKRHKNNYFISCYIYEVVWIVA